MKRKNQYTILKWACQKCGITLSELDYNPLRQYCDTCKNERRNETQRYRQQKISIEKKFNQIKISLFKSWVMWGIRK